MPSLENFSNENKTKEKMLLKSWFISSTLWFTLLLSWITECLSRTTQQYNAFLSVVCLLFERPRKATQHVKHSCMCQATSANSCELLEHGTLWLQLLSERLQTVHTLFSASVWKSLWLFNPLNINLLYHQPLSSPEVASCPFAFPLLSSPIEKSNDRHTSDWQASRKMA